MSVAVVTQLAAQIHLPVILLASQSGLSGQVQTKDKLGFY